MASRINNCTRRLWRTFIVLPAALLLLAGLMAAADQLSREYEIKAVFLYNFAQFTDWPTNAFAQADSPLVIATLAPAGKDPFGPYLDEAVRNEKISGHPLVIKRFTRIEDVKDCHILFVAEPETRQLDKLIKKLAGRSILTVGESTEFAEHGGMIQFIIKSNHVVFRINNDAAKNAGLVISSKILRSAEIVPGPKK